MPTYNTQQITITVDGNKGSLLLGALKNHYHSFEAHLNDAKYGDMNKSLQKQVSELFDEIQKQVGN